MIVAAVSIVLVAAGIACLLVATGRCPLVFRRGRTLPQRPCGELLDASLHELKQPLNGLTGLIDPLRRAAEQGRPLRPEVVQRLDQSLAALFERIDDTATVASIVRGEFSPQLRETDIAAQIRQLAGDMNASLRASGSKINVIVGALPPGGLVTDATLFRRCVRAVVEEAVARSAWGSVKVAARMDNSGGGARLRVFVHDAGRGLSPGLARALVEAANGRAPFGETHPASIMRLRLAAGTARSLGGSLRAESLERDGTRFVVEVAGEACPKAEMPPVIESRDVERTLMTIPRDRLSVLLVDDDPVNLFVLEELVLPMGFDSVVACDSGEAALGHAAEHRFDLVLLDLIMPDMDGFELAARLRASGHCRRAPVLAVTGCALAPGDPRIAEAGIDGIIQKPMRREDVRRAIGEALTNGRRQALPDGLDGETALAG